jgi:hypothetical protein
VSPGPPFLDFLFGAIALVVIALPGMAAARVSPRTVLQE